MNPATETNGTNGPDDQATDTERRVRAVVEEFLARREAGEEADPYELMLAHADIAPEVEERLEAAEALFSLAEHSRTADADADGESSPTAVLASASAVSTLPGPARVAAVGRYQVRETLGSGASGTVYRAYDPKFNREVALKVVRLDTTPGGEFKRRFERDARIAARLRHPNIVPLHETGEYGDWCYIDMELIAGETLEARLRRQGGPLAVPEAIRLVQKAAAALDYAHRAGIVHRDIKPANILIDADGEPQVADFGLARSVGGEETLTLHGQIIGTPAYMSPEQAEGRAHEADRRSDVYSLGVVLYHVLTGRVPFGGKGSLATLLSQILRDEPPRPRSLNPALPAELEAVCLKALEKDPNDRFPTAQALADELWRWLNDEPLTIRPPSVWQRARRWARRNRAVARVVTAAAVLLATVSTVLGWAVYRANLEKRTLDTLLVGVRGEVAAERQTLSALQRSEAEISARRSLELAHLQLNQPRLGRRLRAQESLRDVAQRIRRLPENEVRKELALLLRSAYVTTLGVPDMRGTDQVELGGDPFHLWPVALHPGGREMAVGTAAGPVRWVSGQPGDVLKGVSPAWFSLMAFSPDGKYLVFAPPDGSLTLRDGNDPGRVLKVLVPPGRVKLLALGFDRDTTGLWTCADDGRVQAWSLRERTPGRGRTLPLHGMTLTAAAFHPGATLLAVGTERDGAFWCDLGKGDLNRICVPATPVTALAWSPDGRLVGVGTADGVVQLWRPDGALAQRFTGFGAEVDYIVFHPEGAWVLAGSRSGVGMWDVASGQRVLHELPVPVGFSADGRRLAGTSQVSVSFWELFLPRVLRRLSGHRTIVEKLSWSRDSRRLASLDYSFEVRVWDADRGWCVDEFAAPPGTYYASNAAVALSDDGQLLAFASGGGSGARAVLRDVTRHREVCRSDLPAGYERLAWVGDRFLLVRVQRHKGRQSSVAYEWLPGGMPTLHHVVRRGRPEEQGFFTTELSPGGRTYWWTGPRHPTANKRLEVRDARTGAEVLTEQASARQFVAEASNVSGDGRWLWVRTHADDFWRYDLRSREAPTRTPVAPITTSQNSAWLLWPVPRGMPGGLLRPADADEPWLQLTNDDLGSLRSSCFSPDGRYLAWADLSGGITLLDLPAARQAVREFESAALAP